MLDGVVNLGTVSHETVDVRLQEKHPVRIKELDELVHDPGRQGVVEWNGSITEPRKKLCGQVSGLRLRMQRRQRRR